MIDDDIAWFSVYDVRTDLVMALPVHKSGALYKSRTCAEPLPSQPWLLSHDVAMAVNEEINRNDNLHIRAELGDRLAMRWRVIAKQIEEASANEQVG